MTELQVAMTHLPARGRPGAIESILRAMLLPILAGRRFLAISIPTTVVLFAVGFSLPASSIIGLRTPQVWIGIITPYWVVTHGDIVGILSWVGTAILLCASLSAWSLAVTTPSEPISACWRMGWKRAIHYLLASCLVPTFAVPILLTVISLPLHRLIGLQVTFDWSMSLRPTMGMLIGGAVALVLTWLLLRLLPFSAVVALQGWRSAFPKTWRLTRGLAPRFVIGLCLMAFAMGLIGQAVAAAAHWLLSAAGPEIPQALPTGVMSIVSVFLNLTLSYWICGLMALHISTEASPLDNPTLDVF